MRVNTDSGSLMSWMLFKNIWIVEIYICGNAIWPHDEKGLEDLARYLMGLYLDNTKEFLDRL
jgi:hypothetical protein